MTLAPHQLDALVRWTLGPKLGSGAFRDVYAHPDHKGRVIKIEREPGDFANVKEMEVWRDWRWCPKVAQWLAPCYLISDDGLILVQARTRPLRPEEMPKRLPQFLTDIKPANLGWWRGRIVCHDYSFVRATLTTKLARVPKGAKDRL